MHLEQGQKQMLAANIKGFMRAKRLTLSGLAKQGVSWQTGKNLIEGKVGKYITKGLAARLEKLTSQSLGALITDKIEWKDGELPGRGPARRSPKSAVRKAQRTFDELRANSMFTVEYADGTKIAVPSGMSVSITGPRSIKINGG